MTFAPDDIEIKEFVPTMRGYDRAEVRAFLRAVAEDVRRLEERLTERAMIAMKAEAIAATPSIELLTNSPLEHAIRDLTAAVQNLNPRSKDSDTTPESAEITMTVRLPSEPSVDVPSGPSLDAGQAPVVRESTPSTPPAPPATPASRTSTWDGVERRSAKRPWSGSTVVSQTSAAEPETTTRTYKSGKHVPRHRSLENQSMIAKFLAQALDHRTRPNPNTELPVEDIVKKHVPDFALSPSASTSNSMSDSTIDATATNVEPASLPDNVVPLMRAV